jgi:hypothetical protein
MVFHDIALVHILVAQVLMLKNKKMQSPTILTLDPCYFLLFPKTIEACQKEM